MMATIENLIKNINLPNVIDIAVIALFIYIVVGWLKKAKARFMFLGMLTLGVLYVFARFFHLYLTTLLFQEFFAVALIMIVVIFQEDFRTFFERVATLEITRKHRNVPIDQNALMVNNALINMSRKNVGALVVIQEKDPLDRHLEAGTKIDASLSELLLESIFDPHVPTHDGAVVIDGNRVVHLGTHLPLSTRGEWHDIRCQGCQDQGIIGCVATLRYHRACLPHSLPQAARIQTLELPDA